LRYFFILSYLKFLTYCIHLLLLHISFCFLFFVLQKEIERHKFILLAPISHPFSSEIKKKVIPFCLLSRKYSVLFFHLMSFLYIYFCMNIKRKVMYYVFFNNHFKRDLIIIIFLVMTSLNFLLNFDKLFFSLNFF